MKIYVATYRSGGVIAAGQVEADVKAKAEAHIARIASEIEWRPGDAGTEQLYYRHVTTGRWNFTPARYIEAVDADIDECNYDCDHCNQDDWSEMEDEG